MRSSLFTGLTSAIMATLILTGGAMAGTNSVVNYTADFESYLNGDEIASTNNDVSSEWVAASGAYLVATNAPANDASYLALPNSSHSRVAQLNTEGDSVTNNLDGTGESQVWIDMNIQMVPSDAEPTSVTNDAGIQTAVYMATNGMLTVLCTPAGSVSNGWVELSHDAIDTGTWHRLTVSVSYDANVVLGYDYFQVKLDDAAISSPSAWATTDFGSAQTGTWFECANRSSSHTEISQVLFSGTGYLDDFAVTNQEPATTTFYTNGVPGWWLANYSLAQDNSETGALDNADGDMYVAWEEWLLGTHPGVSNAFQLMIQSNGGTNTLLWVTDAMADENAAGSILLKKSTNLLDGYTSTQTVSRNTLQAGTTNEWEDTTGGTGMYRLSVQKD